MSILTLILEAKKIIPTYHETAYAWLNDLRTTHRTMSNPIIAIRFFMLGMHAAGVISLEQWSNFDLLMVKKNSKFLH